VTDIFSLGIQYRTCRQAPIAGGKNEAEAILGKPGNEVQVDMEDILPGSGTICQEEIQPFAFQLRLV